MKFTQLSCLEEQAHIEEKLDLLKFDEHQKFILMKDLRSPPDFSSLIPLITKPADKSFLINHIRVLAKIDDTLSVEEKAKIEEVKNAVLSKLNLPELNKIIADDEKASYHEDEVYKVDNKHSYAEAVLKSLQKALNPGDYKYPEKQLNSRLKLNANFKIDPKLINWFNVANDTNDRFR